MRNVSQAKALTNLVFVVHWWEFPRGLRADQRLCYRLALAFEPRHLAAAILLARVITTRLIRSCGSARRPFRVRGTPRVPLKTETGTEIWNVHER
jgi:hypothetical protein